MLKERPTLKGKTIKQITFIKEDIKIGSRATNLTIIVQYEGLDMPHVWFRSR